MGKKERSARASPAGNSLRFAGNHPENQKRGGDWNTPLSGIHLGFSRPDLLVTTVRF